MAEIVMFHHAQGLTDGVKAFAEELRGAGHTVHLPDVYEGRTYATLEEGLDYARETGFGTLLERGVKAGEELGEGLVYIGHSLGVMPAQQLTQTRPGAKAGVFLYSCLPASEFGTWPTGVPVQIHAMDGDPFFTEEGGDLDAARELVASTDEAELFLYPGTDHLFADASLGAYDEAAASLLRKRVLAFLETV
ncbi:dienelactone hydrolase family protein [Kribbella sp. NPDC051952]|uniref:dienelactone hydrolase family protein n=1 Tax=Kribbella sp. NPDC051952 TaxID=3154851 RepID=UPI00344AC898